MVIRDLREPDAAAWWDLRLVALESEPLAFGKSPDEHRATALPEFAVSADQVTAGAFVEDALVGIATYRRQTTLKERHKGGIYGVFVAAGHRRAGTARALMAYLLAIAVRDPSVEQLLVGVTSAQPAARALYVSLGFTSYGVEPRALKIGSTYVDEESLILRLR